MLVENLICEKDKDGTTVYKERWGPRDPDGLVPDLVTFRPVLLKPECTCETPGVMLK